MTIEEYAKEVKRTASRSSLEMGAMGLAGETGEVVDIIKKFAYHGHELNHTKLQEELGDVLWYLQLLCNLTNQTLEDLMISNTKKLRARYPNGFNAERSRNRG